MRMLITGGLGYLGGMIAGHFSGKNYDVRIYSKEKAEDDSRYNKYEMVQGDILNKSDLEKAVKDVDYIIHLAAIGQEQCKGNPELALAVNGIGTRNVLEAGEKAKVKRMIYFSTMHVYGSASGLITEETIPNPMTDYAMSKYLGEIYCRQFSKRVDNVVLRFANASLGASTSKNGWNLVVNDLCKQCYLSKGIKLASKGTQKRNFLSISDLNHALEVVLDSKSEDVNGKLFNVGGNHMLSIYEMAETISKVYKKRYGVEAKITAGEDEGMNKVGEFEYSFNKIKKLGYNPKSVLEDEIEGIFKMIESNEGRK